MWVTSQTFPLPLGEVRNHKKVVETTKEFYACRATEPGSAIGSSPLFNRLKIAGIFNDRSNMVKFIAKYPGFVRVISGTQYLWYFDTDLISPIATLQGEDFYPFNTHNLAGRIIPAIVTQVPGDTKPVLVPIDLPENTDTVFTESWFRYAPVGTKEQFDKYFGTPDGLANEFRTFADKYQELREAELIVDANTSLMDLIEDIGSAIHYHFYSDQLPEKEVE